MSKAHLDTVFSDSESGQQCSDQTVDAQADLFHLCICIKDIVSLYSFRIYVSIINNVNMLLHVFKVYGYI